MSSECPVCNEDFYSRGVMRSHMSNAHPQEFERTKSLVQVECDDCGKSGKHHALNVHHINRDKSDNRMSNLQVLCASCHRREHMT